MAEIEENEELDKGEDYYNADDEVFAEEEFAAEETSKDAAVVENEEITDAAEAKENE